MCLGRVLREENSRTPGSQASDQRRPQGADESAREVAGDTQRLLEPIGNVAPVEYEMNYYRSQEGSLEMARLN